MSSEPRIALTSASMCFAAHEIHRLQMREARRAELAAIGLVGAVGDEIDAELALRRLDRRIDFAGRHVVALGIELEVMDQRFHRALHLARFGGAILPSSEVTGPPPVGPRSFSQHCFMMLADWRISSMRMR